MFLALFAATHYGRIHEDDDNDDDGGCYTELQSTLTLTDRENAHPADAFDEPPTTPSGDRPRRLPRGGPPELLSLWANASLVEAGDSPDEHTHIRIYTTRVFF